MSVWREKQATCLTRFTIFSLCVMAATRAAARSVGLSDVSHTLLFFRGALLQSDGGHALAARTDAAEPRMRRSFIAAARAFLLQTNPARC